ncbi:hypothetical protein HMPREF3226_01471 [Prevotella corporis]|uniref:Uncharacterized protein n=1 Tax=Prevotella corporis TaxID=28128 RepID=A0A133Q6V8_9BACT|nr:hypothetical protein HMPREF3226_01471 [Prevotella corporis]
MVSWLIILSCFENLLLTNIYFLSLNNVLLLSYFLSLFYLTAIFIQIFAHYYNEG